MKNIYYALIYPHHTCAIEVWGKASKSIIGRMEKLQKNVVRCVGKAHYLEHTLPLFQKLHILKFKNNFALQTLKEMHLYIHNMIPQPIAELFVRNEEYIIIPHKYI